jgi:hypothetical protein
MKIKASKGKQEVEYIFLGAFINSKQHFLPLMDCVNGSVMKTFRVFQKAVGILSRCLIILSKHSHRRMGGLVLVVWNDQELNLVLPS